MTSKYAVIERAGTYGSHATVLAVFASPEKALGHTGGVAIHAPGKSVGDSVHGSDVGTVYERLRWYRSSGEVLVGSQWVRRELSPIAAISPVHAARRAAERDRAKLVRVSGVI